MKTLKLFIGCFAFLLLSISSLAQSSVEYKVNFNSEKDLVSETFELEAESEDPMARITAYILLENVEAHLYYRLKTGKQWGEWTNMTSFTEAQTEGRITFDGGITEEGFNGIQFKSDKAIGAEVIFRVYYPNSMKKKSRQVNVKKDAGANCSCPQPAVCFRNCWCPSNNCPKDLTPTYTKADHIIVHHSAGTNSSSNWAAVVSSIWDFHVNTNGWDDIGYNWLIDPDGVIYEGRGDSVQGAHFSCMNTETTGICLLGNFVSTAPADSAIASLIRMVAWEGCDKNIAPATSSFHASSQLLLPNIAGHRHGNASTAPNSCAVGTVCPGDSLFSLLQMIRDSAASFACMGDVSISEISFKNELRVYPNPAQSSITVSGDVLVNGGTKQLEIKDHTGRVVISKTINFNSTEGMELDIEYLPAGIYLLTFFQEEFRSSAQFIKN